MIAGLSPVGTITGWAKSLTSMPTLATQGRTEWAEVAGATLSDAQSVFNSAALPAINNNSRFLRGQSTSGGTGGTDAAHSHTLTLQSPFACGASGFGCSTSNSSTGTTDGRPAFYNVVFIMRIK